MQDNIANILQQDIAQRLNSSLSGYAVSFFPENSLDIEFEVKSALAKQGCAGIIVIQSLEYQGHNQIGPAYDINFQLQVAENPTIHRAALKRSSLSTGTGLDIALSSDFIIADVAGSTFGRYCLQSTSQAVENGLVVTTSSYKGLGCYAKDQPLKKWTCNIAYWPEAKGTYTLAQGSTTRWDGPNGCALTMTQEDGKFIFDFTMPDSIQGHQDLHYEVESELRPNSVQFDDFSSDIYINFIAEQKTPHFNWANSDISFEWAMDNIEEYPEDEDTIKIERYFDFTGPTHYNSLFCFHRSNGQLRYEIEVWCQDEYGQPILQSDVIDVDGDPSSLTFDLTTSTITLQKTGPNN